MRKISNIFNLLFNKRTLNLINNKYQITDNTAGFTLIELIIYMGLLSVVVLVFTDIFMSVVDNQLSSTNTSQVSNDGRYIYSRFIYDVSRAQTILEPASYGSPSSSLSLLINGENYEYNLSGETLSITKPNGTFELNGDGTAISDLTFTKIGSGSAKSTVKINFTVTGKVAVRGIFDRKIFQTTAGLR